MKPICGDRDEMDWIWVDNLFKPGNGYMEHSLYYSVYIICLKFFIIKSLKSELNKNMLKKMHNFIVILAWRSF